MVHFQVLDQERGQFVVVYVGSIPLFDAVFAVQLLVDVADKEVGGG